MLVLTTFDDDEYVCGALRAGASGFLLKSRALDAILDAIRVVAAGDALIAPSVTRRLIADFAGTSGPAAPEPDAEPAAAGPLIGRTVEEVLGLPVEVRGKLERLRAKLNRLADRAWLRKLADARFTIG